MTASAGAWYRVGAVNVVRDQQAVTGVGSNWQNDVTAIAVGDIFTLDAKTWYEVIAVSSDTSITLDRGFEGSTQNAANYAIVRNTSGTILTRIAGQIAVQFNQKQLFLDELRKWLNSDNASEELTDSHGVKKSLKTPAQMVRDHEIKLAEIDAIHPFPWAMRKVDFEAMRAANNEKYAASGFVHFGKAYSAGTNGIPINEGLWARIATDNINTLRIGNNPVSSSIVGISKEYSGILNIAGVITDIASLGSNSYITYIKFPSAEDGTRIYDSTTGLSVVHATPALAFAAETATNKVVTDRVDMWGFEAFLREINDFDPFVYKNGLIQSSAIDIDGVATVDDNVRPDTYFAWYKGDTTSRGKGVNWQTATESQRSAIASDLKNNIYFDDSTGKFYQWCVRGRSFAGPGNGDWQSLDKGFVANALAYDSFNRVSVLGNKDSTADGKSLVISTRPHYYGNSATNSVTKRSEGGFIPFGTSDALNYAPQGECHFLVCGTVNRLNQGVYHPSFNPLGSGGMYNKTLGTHIKWHQKPNFFVNKSSCFQWGDNVLDSEIIELSTLRGSIAGETIRNGRPDGRFYDVIYADGFGGVCRDMRYSANGLTTEDFKEADLKLHNGEYRGVETLTTPLKKSIQVAPSSSLIYFDREGIRPDFYTSLLAIESVYVRVVSNSGATFRTGYENFDNGDWYEMEPVLSSSNTVLRKKGGAVQIVATGNSSDLVIDVLIVGTSAGYFPSGISNPIASNQLHAEVIGHPSKIMLCNDLKDGWIGSYNPTLPEGVIKSYKLNRPVIDIRPIKYQTNDQGITWGEYNIATVEITNDYTSSSIGMDYVAIIFYETKSRMVKNTSNTKVYEGAKGIGDVSLLSFYAKTWGVDLAYSCISKVLTNDSSTKASERLPVVRYGLRPSGELDHTVVRRIMHENLENFVASTSPAVKALTYNSSSENMGILKCIYKELKYDDAAADWGDDNTLHIINNQGTLLDDNGETVIIGLAECVEPLGWLKNDK